MKFVSSELNALLDSGSFITAVLYTLTLQDGTVVRVTSMADYAVVWQGHTFSHDDLSLEYSSIRQAVGIEVDNVDVTLHLNKSETLQGLAVPYFVRNGGFNGARLLIQRAYLSRDDSGNINPVAVGVIFRFEGRVTEPQGSRTQVDFKVVADTELLNNLLPRNTTSASCMNLLYDARCSLNKAAYSHNGAVTAATKMSLSCGLTHTNDFYTHGTVTFTSGQNAGARRTVKKYTTGNFVFSRAFEYVPQADDTFIAVAGCDLSEATCAARFDNLANRRAFKHIPVYEENL